MQLKKVKYVIVFLAVGFMCYMYIRIPPIEELKVKSETVTIPVGQTIQVVEDLYPDPSFVRLKVKSMDTTIAEVAKDPFCIKGVAEGETTVRYFDRKVEIKRIIIYVIP